MTFAASLSEHPDAAEAVGEVVGAVLEGVGPEPHLAVLFVTGAHREHVEEIARTCRELLRPGVLAGVTAVSVIGGDREVEDQPAVALWAARFDAPAGLAPVPVRLEALRTPDGIAVLGLDMDDLDDVHAMVLLADPISFPLDEFLAVLREQAPDVPIIGGVASADFSPGGNGLILDGEVHTDGAIGVLLPEGLTEVELVVSQGCRPIGEPHTVTRSERNMVYEVAGRPALERLLELLATLPDEERELAQQGLHVGRVIDEHKLDFTRGDFLIRNLMGANREEGALVVNDVVDLGSTIQFQVRDADAADDDLRALLVGHQADAALVFTCNGRGIRLFGEPDHDAAVVTDLTGSRTTAGMFCAGEIGPIGGQNFLHGFTASVALFKD